MEKSVRKSSYNKLIKAGTKAQFQGNSKLAFSFFQQAIEEDPKSILGYILIDRVLRELGKLEEANRYYNCISQTIPEVWNEEYILRLRVGHVRDGILIPFSNRNLIAPHQAGIKTNRTCPPYFYHLRYNFKQTTDINYLEQQDLRTSAKLHGTYLYAGFAFRHFGHYMAECTHRLWAYSKLSSQIQGVVILPESKKNNSTEFHELSLFMKQAMTYMQIPLESVHLLSKVSEIEHLFVPEQASMLGNKLRLSSDYLDFLAENEERFFHSYQPQLSKYPEKLYVSRSHLIDKGGIAGEAYIENLLQEYEDFFILKPENYSLYEQMNHYRHAKVCIFSEGSSIHGLELLGWLNNMSKVAIIFRRSQNNNILAGIIASRSQNLCEFQFTKTIHPLVQQRIKKNPAIYTALSIFSNVDLLLQFFRDNNLAQLKDFSLNDFYRQEAIDISRYLMKIKVNPATPDNFLPYFEQFRRDIQKSTKNPYLI